MSREKDSAIVYELVTSKYKIAERNRLAKFRFLNEMRGETAVKRRGSEPSSTAPAVTVEVKKFDLSVPGTPVSSRYISSLKKFNRHNLESDSETENEDNDNESDATDKRTKFHSELEDGLKKFTADMEKLQQDVVSHDPLQKYFEESDKKKSYRRDFSEVVSEFPSKKKEPATVAKVERYFQESERVNSFKRDFSEVVQTFGVLKKPTGDPFTDLLTPGTPISSRLIAAEKLKSVVEREPLSDIKISNETVENSQVGLNSNEIQNRVADVIPPSYTEIEVAGREKESFSVDEYFKQSDALKTYRRDFSEVTDELNKPREEKNPAIENYFSQSEAQKSFQRTFSQATQSVQPRIDEIIKSVANGNALQIVEGDDVVGVIEIEDDAVKETLEVEEEEVKTLHVREDEQQHSAGLEVIEEKGEAVEVPEIENETPAPPPANDLENPTRLKRSDSASSHISIPGTPISSRDLPSSRGRNSIDIDDSGSEVGETTVEEIRALAMEFVQEIETLVQKSFDDDDRQEIVLGELKKITSENVDGSVENEKLAAGESDEKLIIHEPQQDDSNPDGSGNKVEDYFTKSERENTYTRTFSEVDHFNKTPMDVKEKVENYFRESEKNKSFTRPFSQAVNYIAPKIDIETMLKPGTPVSSKDVMCLKQQQKQVSNVEDDEVDAETLKGKEAFKKAEEALHGARRGSLKVEAYFKQSDELKTYRRDFSEVIEELNKTKAEKNPMIDKYFEQSEAQRSFQRAFSEATQEVPPRIDEILKIEEKPEKPLGYQRTSRASSVSSNCSDLSESDPRKIKKHGKKYGIDKYFAASLYRTAYHRSQNARRESGDIGNDPEHELKIVEDEFVFGETDLLRQHEFQHDDETRVTQGTNDVNENQTVTFWRDFLKPYNLNLHTEISITKDDLLNNRTLE